MDEMSKPVNEVVADIYKNPETWAPETFHKNGAGGYSGIKKDNIRIYGMGNTKILSIIHIHFNDSDFPTSYIDQYRLEKACLWWYEQAPKTAFKPK